MKLRSLIVGLILASVFAVVSWQTLWFVYDVLDLFSVSVDSFTNLTLAVSGGGALAILYSQLRGKTVKEAKKAKGKTKSKDLLNKDITIKDVAETLKPSKKASSVEFIIIGDGKNLHQTLPFKPNTEYKTGGNAEHTSFKVENANLLVQKPMLKRKKLVAIFMKDGTPIKVKGSDTNITAEILGLAQRSAALEEKVKEMFITQLPIKKILFFVIIGVVGAIVYFLFNGGL